jgi:hypothetical protein
MRSTPIRMSGESSAGTGSSTASPGSNAHVARTMDLFDNTADSTSTVAAEGGAASLRPDQAAHWTVEQVALAKLGTSAPASSSSKQEPDESMRDGAGGTGNRASSVWSTEEDENLRSAVQAHSGKNWKAIAAVVPSKTSIQCLHRWRKVLDPQLVKGAWTAEEDNMIRELVGQNGARKW